MVKEDEILAELKLIRNALNPPPAKPREGKIKLFEDFNDFLKRHNVMGLIIAIVFGLFFFILIYSLIYNLLIPIIEMLFYPLYHFNFGLIQFGAFFLDLTGFLISILIMALIVKLIKRRGFE